MAAEAAYNAPTRVLRRFTPSRPRRNGLTARPQARSRDAVMDGCCHSSPILYPIPRIMSMATRKSKPTGERFYTRFTFLETRQIRRVTCRRGETPHLLESSLIAICDRASNGKQHNKLRRFTKRLRYRCGMSFALLNRPHPTRRGGLYHGEAASSRVKFAALPKGVRRSATDIHNTRKKSNNREHARVENGK